MFLRKYGQKTTYYFFRGLFLTSYFACNDLRAVSWFFERLLFRFFAIFGSELVFFDCLRDEARRSPMLFILSLLLIGWRHFGHFLVSFAQDEQHIRWAQGLNWIVGVDSSQIKHRSGIISLSWKGNVFLGTHMIIIYLDNFFADETFFDSIDAFVAAETVPTRKHNSIWWISRTDFAF